MRPAAAIALALAAPSLSGQIAPEEPATATLPEPGPNWFIAKTGNGGYIFDAESGEMQGLLSLSRRTPAVAAWPPRREFYAAESYMTRDVRGERTDLVAVYDFENLSPVAEIVIPNRMARLSVRRHLGLMNDGRHLAVLNMNPGHSVSIVDVEDRVFIYEISTPGCAVIMPVARSDFLQLCGDGTLQLIQLDVSGFERNRVRSEPFFSVADDAVFDRAARGAGGWILISHAGTVFEAGAEGGRIAVSEGWSAVPPDEDGWRPGGGELLAVHERYGLLYVAMHQGGKDTHHEPGEEIWVYSLDARRRVHRLELEVPAESIMVTQEAEPKLVVGDEDGDTHVYDALSFAHERSISMPGAAHYEDF